jgi:hypothetical protein
VANKKKICETSKHDDDDGLHMTHKVRFVNIEIRRISVIPRAEYPVFGQQVTFPNIVCGLVFRAHCRLDNQMGYTLVVLLSHTAAHVMHQAYTMGNNVLVVFAKPGEAHDCIVHQVAVQWPVDIGRLAQFLESN